MTSSETWAAERNLDPKRERELFLYLIGRIGKEPLPEDLLIIIAHKVPRSFAEHQEN